MLFFDHVHTALRAPISKSFFILLAICLASGALAALIVWEAGYPFFWEIFSFLLIATICAMLVSSMLPFRRSKLEVSQPEQ